MQAALPKWLRAHGPAEIQDKIDSLDQAAQEQRFDDAEKAADTILQIIK